MHWYFRFFRWKNIYRIYINDIYHANPDDDDNSLCTRNVQHPIVGRSYVRCIKSRCCYFDMLLNSPCGKLTEFLLSISRYTDMKGSAISRCSCQSTSHHVWSTGLLCSQSHRLECVKNSRSFACKRRLMITTDLTGHRTDHGCGITAGGRPVSMESNGF